MANSVMNSIIVAQDTSRLFLHTCLQHMNIQHTTWVSTCIFQKHGITKSCLIQTLEIGQLSHSRLRLHVMCVVPTCREHKPSTLNKLVFSERWCVVWFTGLYTSFRPHHCRVWKPSEVHNMCCFKPGSYTMLQSSSCTVAIRHNNVRHNDDMTVHVWSWWCPSHPKIL